MIKVTRYNSRNTFFAYKLRTLILAFVTMTAMVANAAKAVPGSMQVILQDGRSVTVSLFGDENLHFLASSDGELIIREGNTYRVATEEEKDELTAECMALNEVYIETQAKAVNSLRADATVNKRLFPHSGKQKVLVLMAEFADVKFTYSRNDIDSLLNSDNILSKRSNVKSYSSVAKYFNDCSDGQFQPEFDVFGPYTLSSNMAVYGAGNDNMSLFIPEVCNLANSEVDFSEYDADGDGYVDLVYIIYAGYSANWTQNGDDCIWPKSGPASNTTTNYGTYDGKTVFRYGVNGELLAYEGIVDTSGKPYLNGIGVFCHEFSHTMGMPDFYPTTRWTTYYNGKYYADCNKYDNQSLEDWDLMDNGENSVNGCWPPMYTAFERELMGWTTIDVLDTPSDITLTPLIHGGKAYKILNENDDNEYWILEAISTDATSEGWQQHMPGMGMTITHVNYNASTFDLYSNSVNNTAGKPGITLIPADGYLPTSYRVDNVIESFYMSREQYRIEESGDPYPGSSGITEFNNYKAYTGTIDKPITEIIQNDDFSVSFKFMGGAPPLLGDANNDGFITMADANLVVNYFLATDKDSIQINLTNANVNQDEDITMADANAIVNLFLGNESEE